jgi:hypothetical protein
MIFHFYPNIYVVEIILTNKKSPEKLLFKALATTATTSDNAFEARRPVAGASKYETTELWVNPIYR